MSADAVPGPERHWRTEDGADLPFQVWRFRCPQVVASSASVGGGLGPRSWVLNAQVRSGYARTDLDRHVGDLASRAGLAGDGVGLLTAADATTPFTTSDGGVRAWASVGVSMPVWAARPPQAALDLGQPSVGTINIVVALPVPAHPAALINLVATATEAKVQALGGCGIDGSGTVTDAVTIIAPLDDGLDGIAFGGTGSTWGTRTSRAVHQVVADGTREWTARHG